MDGLYRRERLNINIREKSSKPFVRVRPVEGKNRGKNFELNWYIILHINLIYENFSNIFSLVPNSP